MKRVLQKQRSALKFLASARTSIATGAKSSQLVLTANEADKLFKVLEEDFKEIEKCVISDSPSTVELSNKMSKLWPLILTLKKNDNFLRELLTKSEGQGIAKNTEKDSALRIQHSMTTGTTLETDYDQISDSKLALELAASREMFEKEKQHMLKEIINLKENQLKSNNHITELQEMERKYKIQIQDLKNHLESQVADTMKELKLRQLHENQIKELQKQLDDKDKEMETLLVQFSNMKEQSKLLESVISEQKLTNELLSQNNSHLSQKILKLHAEYNGQLTTVEDLTQKYVYVSKQMKTLEENSMLLTSDLVRNVKLKESIQKKLQLLENQKKDVMNENEKLCKEIRLLKKDIEKLNQLFDEKKKASEKLQREKELLIKNLQHLRDANDEQGRILKTEIRVKDQLNSRIDHLSKKEYLLTETVDVTKKENENLKSNVSDLQNCNKSIKANLRETEDTMKQLRNKLYEMELNQKHQAWVLESTVKAKNKISEKLIHAKEEITELKEFIESLKNKLEKEKENMDEKETELLNEKSILQKLEQDKEKLYREIQNNKETIQHLNNSIQAYDKKIHNLDIVVQKQERELQKKDKTILQMTSDHDLMSAKLLQYTEEIIQLKAREKLSSLTQEKQESECKEHSQEMEKLKFSIKKLGAHKLVLNKTLSIVSDLRSEIFSLQKNLTRERIKCRALEDELQNPLNIHRWRKLQGTDPNSYELVSKVQHLQRRVLEKSRSEIRKDLRLEEMKDMYENLKETTTKLTSSKIMNKLYSFQKEAEVRKRKMKHLLVEIYMYEFHAAESKQELIRKNDQLRAIKKNYYKQKKLLYTFINSGKKLNSKSPVLSTSASFPQEAVSLEGYVNVKSILPSITS